MLTGDHLLPRISPNIGLHPGADASLADFLASPDRVAGHDDHEAPADHEYRFTGLADPAAASRTTTPAAARRCSRWSRTSARRRRGSSPNA